MIRKRSRYDSMAPSAEPSWLLVENQYTDLVFAKEYPPLANRINIMIEALATSVAKGWEVEGLPGEYPVYFCRKGQNRYCVFIGPPPAADRLRNYMRRAASRSTPRT